MNVGSVVYSQSGRDLGRIYMVLKVDPDKAGYVFVVDGDVRTLDNPKRKNAKHLAYKGEELAAIADKLQKGVKVYDSEIKSALRAVAK